MVMDDASTARAVAKSPHLEAWDPLQLALSAREMVHAKYVEDRA